MASKKRLFQRQEQARQRKQRASAHYQAVLAQQQQAQQQVIWSQQNQNQFQAYIYTASTSRTQPRQPLPHEIVAEPITAWRIWKVTELKELLLDKSLLRRMADRFDAGQNPFAGLLGHRLMPVAHGSYWEPGKHSASCHVNYYLVSNPHTGPAPAQGCSCGIWAVNSRELAEQTLAEYRRAGAQFALGTVQLWGRIIECQKGYRAEHARPLELEVYADQSVADELAEFYGCQAVAKELPRVEAATWPVIHINSSRPLQIAQPGQVLTGSGNWVGYPSVKLSNVTSSSALPYPANLP